jgi:hypothetical protein
VLTRSGSRPRSPEAFTEGAGRQVLHPGAGPD